MTDRRFRRRFGRWLLEGGALIAILGGAYQVYGDRDGDRSAKSLDLCRSAEEAIRDDALNAGLTVQQRDAVLTRKLRISERCDRMIQ